MFGILLLIVLFAIFRVLLKHLPVSPSPPFLCIALTLLEHLECLLTAKSCIHTLLKN
jgi:hypothetical protein